MTVNKPPFSASEQELAKLSKMDRPLNKEEISKVVDHIPLLVLGEDDKMMQRMCSEVIRRSRQGAGSVLVLHEGTVAERFEASEKADAKELPIIVCHDGIQSAEATEILCNQRIQPGILALDQGMGAGPKGTEILQMYHERMPEKLTRVMQSSDEPKDISAKIEAGVFDAYVNKMSITGFPEVIRAYLLRTFGHRPK